MGGRERRREGSIIIGKKEGGREGRDGGRRGGRKEEKPEIMSVCRDGQRHTCM